MCLNKKRNTNGISVTFGRTRESTRNLFYIGVNHSTLKPYTYHTPHSAWWLCVLILSESPIVSSLAAAMEDEKGLLAHSTVVFLCEPVYLCTKRLTCSAAHSSAHNRPQRWEYQLRLPPLLMLKASSPLEFGLSNRSQQQHCSIQKGKHFLYPDIIQFSVTQRSWKSAITFQQRKVV